MSMRTRITLSFIFMLTLGSLVDAQTLSTITSFQFQAADGFYPGGSIAVDTVNHEIYGSTYYGGLLQGTDGWGNGVLYKIDANGGYHVLYQFRGENADSSEPNNVSALQYDPTNQFVLTVIGTSYAGGRWWNEYNLGSGGTFFATSLAGNQWQNQILLSVVHPIGGLLINRTVALGTDTLYSGGQTSPAGNIFNLDAPNQLVYGFQGWDPTGDGQNPQSDLVEYNGRFYGTTYEGGITNGQNQGWGTIYEASQVGSGAWAYKQIYQFQAGADGSSPKGGLVLGQNPQPNNFVLYGTTSAGGLTSAGFCQLSGLSPSGCGTVYKLTYSGGTWRHQVIYEFRGNAYGDGEAPIGTPIIGPSGDLYGVTEGLGTAYGQSYNQGSVWRLHENPDGSWTEEYKDQNGQYHLGPIHLFTGGSDGGYPFGELATDGADNLYGTTSQGGVGGGGTVFKLTEAN